MSSDIKRNSEGYKDSTAYRAIMSIEELKKRKMKEQDEHDKLVQHIKYVVELAGFKLSSRVRLVHRQSGRRYE
nr:MAG TPA: hypothetical protein [Caudoviricetes sp.]